VLIAYIPDRDLTVTFAVRLIVLTVYVVALSKLAPGFLASGNTIRELVDVFALFLYVWCALANSAKRWHDTNRSAIHVLLIVVPAVGAAISIALNLAVEGTAGPNRFGPPPGKTRRSIVSIG
jgi:uncharacterized membrane protein YhaH (DUF805 family)